MTLKKGDLMEIAMFNAATNAPSDPAYGEYLTTDGKGRYIIELKGSGNVIVVDKRDAQKVMPFTVDVKFKNSDGSWSDTNYSYTVPEGMNDLAVDDLILVDNATRGSMPYVKIVAVDTKSDKATKQLSGWRLSTTKF